MLPSYPKVYRLGHKAIAKLLFDPVIVQEKIDGSQISFGLIGGSLQIRSHHTAINPDYPKGMFAKAVDVIKRLDLMEGWVYRGEYLEKPHHNTLKYDRIPKQHIILYDIQDGIESYLGWREVVSEAERLGLETVPVLDKDYVSGELDKLLERESCLGGTTIEGVVLKNYYRFGIDKHCLMGKYVSKKFQELHQKTWNKSAKKDLVLELAEELRTEARWEKTVQSFREKGELTGEAKDIGPLLKALNENILEEESDYIKEKIFKWVWKKLSHQLVKGFPDWYKKRIGEKNESND